MFFSLTVCYCIPFDLIYLFEKRNWWASDQTSKKTKMIVTNPCARRPSFHSSHPDIHKERERCSLLANVQSLRLDSSIRIDNNAMRWIYGKVFNIISGLEWPILVISKSFLQFFPCDLWANMDRFHFFLSSICVSTSLHSTPAKVVAAREKKV